MGIFDSKEIDCCCCSQKKGNSEDLLEINENYKINREIIFNDFIHNYHLQFLEKENKMKIF